LPLPDEDIFTVQAVAINDAGDTLGFGIARGDDGHDLNLDMIWKSDGSFVRLAVDTQSGKGTDAEVRDINNHGVVVGMVWGQRNAMPAVWTKTGMLLPVSVAPLGSQAVAVNDSGMVAGGGYGGTRIYKHAFSWTPGSGVLDLGDLAGGSGSSGASGMNNSGQIVGYSTVSNPTPENLRAVLWDADGTMHDLGVLPDDGGHQGYQAYRINNLGEVLGNGDGRNWLWTAGAGMLSIDSMIDPNDPLRSYGGIDMHALNDAGVVVGGLVNYTIRTIPVMLVPQP
jgi:probable HAF family extracellular repeat protein